MKSSLAVLLLLAIPAFASDVLVSSLTLDKSSVSAGERATATMRIRNAGPDASPTLLAELFFHDGAGTFISATGPAGWTCSGAFVERVHCTGPSMPAGAEVQIQATFLTDDGGVVRGDVNASNDADGGNNTRTVPIAVSGADADRGDLSVTVTAPQERLLPGATGQFQVLVQNHGPTAAHDISVAIGLLGLQTANEGTLSAHGIGWSCAPIPAPFAGGPRVVCTRGTLTFPTTINATFTVPAEGRVRAEAFVIAEGNLDQNRANDTASSVINVGNAADWQRLLLPITLQTANGAFGARWVTEINAIVQSDGEIGLGAPCVYATPEAAEAGNCSTPGYEHRKPFDAFDYGWVSACSSPGQFIYISRDDADRLRMNMRVRDVSRAHETAGSEIPIVAEDAFRSGSISLLNIPSHDQYRYTLRIYDGDAHDGAMVNVKVYANEDDIPLVSSSRTLNASCSVDLSTPFDLPSHPASTQFDLSALGADVNGFDSFRIEIAPVTPGIRIWAFVSITNNETHHVTIVSPNP